MRITVIATGFDEMRSRLGRLVAPPVLHIHKKEELKTQEEILEAKENDKGEEKTKIEELTGKDEWGEKFEIPAFLRQIRN